MDRAAARLIAVVIQQASRGFCQSGEGVGAIMANWLMLTPWLIFGTVLAVICYRMLRSHTSAHRHRQDGR